MTGVALPIFRRIARPGGVTRAAKELDRTQPAVSAPIDAL